MFCWHKCGEARVRRMRQIRSLDEIKTIDKIVAEHAKTVNGK